jgi:hypothetical protein
MFALGSFTKNFAIDIYKNCRPLQQKKEHVFVAMQKWLTTFIYYRLVDNKNHKLYLPK